MFISILFFTPPAHSGLLSDTWNALTNNKFVNKTLGVKLRCTQDNHTGSRENTLILNDTLSTMVWETVDGESLNFKMKIIKSETAIIEAEYNSINLIEAGYNPIIFLKAGYNTLWALEPGKETATKAKIIFDDIKYAVSKMKIDSEKKRAYEAFLNHKSRVILNRITGEARFITDAYVWGSQQPKDAVDINNFAEYYQCEKVENKF